MTDLANASLDGIDSVLAGLPPACVVASSGVARLVVGPPGAFVLLPSGADPSTTAERAGHLAATTRAALAEHVSWVPFIDAVVIHDTPLRNGSATSVPLDLLPETLVEGPVVIDPSTVAMIRHLLDEGQLPNWRTGVCSEDGKIDLCEPVDDVPAAS
ncbi:hypothetical protein [Rhabdothermincola sp.]|uniref:hypothetical protein n=1 Tax=Rhabdothermincola sp. TaxID=2820405 RepID=UPI002FE24198